MNHQDAGGERSTFNQETTVTISFKRLFLSRLYNKSYPNLCVALKTSKRAPSEFRSRVAMEDETAMTTSLINLLQNHTNNSFQNYSGM